MTAAMGRGRGRLRALTAHLTAADAAAAAVIPADLQPAHVRVPRFPVGSVAANEYMAQHGFCVYASAITQAECSEVLDEMWAYLEALGTGILRSNPRTWCDENWPDKSGVGLVCNAGVTHTGWAWRIRSHPNVIAAWASVLGFAGTELITSLDCLSMFRPWRLEQAEPSWRTKGAWWHTDQTVDIQVNGAGQEIGGPHREYVQGFVTMVDTSVVHTHPS
jgi:hypothetical protein